MSFSIKVIKRRIYRHEQAALAGRIPGQPGQPVKYHDKRHVAERRRKRIDYYKKRWAIICARDERKNHE